MQSVASSMDAGAWICQPRRVTGAAMPTNQSDFLHRRTNRAKLPFICQFCFYALYIEVDACLSGRLPCPSSALLSSSAGSALFQHEARREPVEITRGGRREFVLMSADQYDWLRASAQRSHRTDTAADLVIDAVERAEMDVEHKSLDDLLT